MSKPFQITVNQSVSELKALRRKAGELIGKRIQMLIEIKKHEGKDLSKRLLSDMTGINHNSITKWRRAYLKDGIDALLVHGRKGGYKKQIISAENKVRIQDKLNDPKNGIRGYVEFQSWVKKELGVDIKYVTLHKYCQRNFGTKIKVARKSHVKKDEGQVEAFKKTSRTSVRK